MTQATTDDATVAALRRLIARFMDAAHLRSDCDGVPLRRGRRRYHRSWPLLVSFGSGPAHVDIGVALHNASETGIAFLTNRPIGVGEEVFIKLFWHEPDCPRIAAVTRHVTRSETAYLVGCGFLPADRMGSPQDNADRFWYE